MNSHSPAVRKILKSLQQAAGGKTGSGRSEPIIRKLKQAISGGGSSGAGGAPEGAIGKILEQLRE